MEAFCSTMMREVSGRFDSCGETTMELSDDIEVFYDQRRRPATSAPDDRPDQPGRVR